MKIVSSMMTKGGTGKTSLSVHLTHYLAQHGHKTLLIDLDRERNASRAFLDELPEVGVSQLYQKNGAKRVEILPASDTELVHVISGDLALRAVRPEQVPVFVDNLRDIAQRQAFDYVVLDTPPTPHDDMAAPLDVSDFVFVPVIPDRYGIENAYELSRMVHEAVQRRGDELHFLGFVVNQFNPRIEGHRDVLAAMRESFNDELCPIAVNYRAAYVNASFESKPVWKTLEGKKGLGGAAREAAKEMRGALSWLYEKMEKTNG